MMAIDHLYCDKCGTLLNTRELADAKIVEQQLRASLRECVEQLKFLNSVDVKASTNVVLVRAIKVLDGKQA
jgi:hypothetical protein